MDKNEEIVREFKKLVSEYQENIRSLSDIYEPDGVDYQFNVEILNEQFVKIAQEIAAK